MCEFCYSHPRPAVTVDIVCLRSEGQSWRVLLIRRKHEPFAGYWALPGGFVDADEDLEQAARRELKEETGIEPMTLRQFYCFGRPGRDPRGWTISVAFLAICDDNLDEKIRAGDDADDVRWFAVDELPELAFDHKEIIEKSFEFL